MALELRPDVLLHDGVLIETDAYAYKVILSVLEFWPDARILLVASIASPKLKLALDAGAIGYLIKTDLDALLLVEAVLATHKGNRNFSPEFP